jgi:hypothetical protein
MPLRLSSGSTSLWSSMKSHVPDPGLVKCINATSRQSLAGGSHCEVSKRISAARSHRLQEHRLSAAGCVTNGKPIRSPEAGSRSRPIGTHARRNDGGHAWGCRSRSLGADGQAGDGRRLNDKASNIDSLSGLPERYMPPHD